MYNLNDGGGKETVMKPRGSFRLALWGFVAAALCAAPAMAQYEPVLSLDGRCPGVMRAEVNGARPRSGLSLLFASETGSVTIPWFWQHCPGVELGLGRRNLREVASGTTDESGNLIIEGRVRSRACGGYLQVLTFPLGGCLTTNVVQIE